MIGLKGVPSSESGLPQREEIEQWWVEGMNSGADWHSTRGAGGKSQREVKEEEKVWHWPIEGMG